MDFAKAIYSHTVWKSRFRQFIDGDQEVMDASAVAQDDQCELGRWIHHEGTQYENVEAYRQLRECHQKFHLCAGQVVDCKSRGDIATATHMISDLRSDYSVASSLTIKAIRALQDYIKAQDEAA